MHRILFLCMGNICRSPAAHCILQQRVDALGRTAAFAIDSAGTIAIHAGEAPDARMQAALRARGIPVIGRARQIRPADLEHFDLILAMDEANLADARQLDREGPFHHKIKLFCAFCRQHEAKTVPDPYYGGARGFTHVLDLIEDGCGGLLQALDEGADSQ